VQQLEKPMRCLENSVGLAHVLGLLGVLHIVTMDAIARDEIEADPHDTTTAATAV
jgi:hypothetical protein